MPLVIFRSRLRADIDMTALEALGARMAELATAMPGFVSYKDYAAADGESVTLVEFADDESLLVWREHPEHRVAQQRARDEFMSWYRIDVCGRQRAHEWGHGG